MTPSGHVTRREVLGTAAALAAGSAMPADEPGNQADRPPDAVFIGAGINSLGAAYLLGKAGWRVLVLDRNQEPGGAIRTLELTQPGFRHDIGAMNLSVFAHSPFFREHGAALARKGVEVLTADRPFGSAVSSDRFLGISTDRSANLRAIAAFARADAEAWKTWNADFDRCAPILFRIFGSSLPASQPLDYVFGEGEVPEAVRPALRGILLDSLRTNLTARFESEAVRALVAAWGLHIDYAPDVTGGCWMPFLETNADERTGIALIKGGSGQLMNALADLIRDTGGEVRTGQTVEKIVVADGRATGVRLAGGEFVRCSRAVVASVTPTALLKLTDGHLPENEARRAREWVYGPGTLMIHLALSDLPEWKAGPDARRSFYVHVAPSLDYLAAAYQQGMAGILSAAPFCVVSQPTVYDPTRAPPGKHVWWIMVRAVPAVIKGDAAGQIRGPAWTAENKEAFADRVLDLLEGYAPGLRGKVLARAIHSPTDLEALNPNLVGGDLNAGSQHLSQFYGQRPFPGCTGYRMPIAGLYMCGASTWPGGGANVGSGALLARVLLTGNP